MFDAEFVLFVDDDEGEDLNWTASERRACVPTTRWREPSASWARICWRSGPVTEPVRRSEFYFFTFEEVGEGDEVLFGEDFGRGHEGGLAESIFDF